MTALAETDHLKIGLYRFNQPLFTRAWRFFKVRPPAGDSAPERTDEKYCIYDEPHRDYLYSRAYVKRLIRELGTEDGYRQVLAIEPVAKDVSIRATGS